MSYPYSEISPATIAMIRDQAARRHDIHGTGRREILDLLREQGPMKSGQVAAALGKATHAASYLLKALQAEGLACTAGYGLWTTSSTPQSTQSPQTDDDTSRTLWTSRTSSGLDASSSSRTSKGSLNGDAVREALHSREREDF